MLSKIRKPKAVKIRIPVPKKAPSYIRPKKGKGAKVPRERKHDWYEEV